MPRKCSSGALHATVDLVGWWQEVQQMLPLAVHWASMATLCSVVENAMVDASIAAGQWVDQWVDHPGRAGLEMASREGLLCCRSTLVAAVSPAAHCVQYGRPYPSVGCWHARQLCMLCTLSDSASLSDDPRVLHSPPYPNH